MQNCKYNSGCGGGDKRREWKSWGEGEKMMVEGIGGEEIVIESNIEAAEREV